MAQRFRESPRFALWVAILALFTDSLVFSIIVPILPSYLGDYGTSQTAIGVMFFAYALALLVATPVFGAIVESHGCRSPMLLGFVGIVVTTGLFAIAETLPALIIARCLQGIAAAATATASLAMLAQAFPPADRGRVMGLATAGNATGALIGPPLGGFLFAQAGPLAPLALIAGLAAIDGAARALLILPEAAPSAARTSLRTITGHPVVRKVGMVVIVGAAALTLLEAALPLHLQQNLGASQLLTGAAFTLSTIAFAVSAPVVGALEARWGRLRASGFGLLALAILLPTIGLAPNLLWAFAAIGLVGAGVGLTITPTLPALAEVIDSDGGRSYGLVYAAFNMAWAIGMVLGPLVGSVFVDVFSLRAVLFGFSAVAASTSVALLLRRGRETARVTTPR
jgi:MFS transporter, DHA1 family, solute carrier family 18 (vesicular amine transporter), member 1/2